MAVTSPLKVTAPVARSLFACNVRVPIFPPTAPVTVVVPEPETRVKSSAEVPATVLVRAMSPAVAAPVVMVVVSVIVSAAMSIFVSVVVIVPAAVVVPAIEPKPPVKRSESSLRFPNVTPFVFRKFVSLVIVASSLKITA